MVDFEILWGHLCATVRRGAENGAVMCPGHADDFRREAEDFCNQRAPVDINEHLLRQATVTGLQGTWSNRILADFQARLFRR
jgi:hypothetical protein